MTSSDRLQFRTFLIGIALIPPTALSIYLIYGPYLFNKWPWIRFSILMALLTCLWTYTFWFARITGGNADTTDPLSFAVIVIPLDIIIMYPGPKSLGVNSDSNLYVLIIVLVLIHGSGSYFIQREIKKFLSKY